MAFTPITEADLDPVPQGFTPVAEGDLDPQPTAQAAPEDNRGFFERGWDTFKKGASDVGHVLKEQNDLASRALFHPIDTFGTSEGRAKAADDFILTNPSKRREFERGIDNMVTLGGGQRVANTVGTSLGDDSLSEEQHAKDAKAAPGYSTTGSLIGGALPGAASKIGELGGMAVKAGSKLVAPALGRLAETPLLGAATRTLAPVAKGVAGYEASAPAIAGLSADAEGHRLEAAKAAALDPAGLILSGGAPVVGGLVDAGASKAANAVKGYIDRAPQANDEWLIKDLRGESKGETTPTARKYLAADDQNVVATVNSDPKLKAALSDARYSDRGALEKASDVLDRKLSEVTAPREDLYDKKVDVVLDGAATSGDVVDKLRAAAEEHRRDGSGAGHKIAEQLELGADRIEKSQDWGLTKTTKLDPKTAQDVADLQTARANVKDPATLAQIDDQIAALQATGKPTTTFDRNKVIPMRLLRSFVTDIQNSAFDGLGGLASTTANVRSRVVAGSAKNILDGYLDRAAAKEPAAVAQIRKLNTEYSALKTVQRVIDQRLGKAKENATGAGGGLPTTVNEFKRNLVHGGGLAGGAFLLGTGHPGLAAATVGLPYALKGAVNGARALGEKAATLSQSPAYLAKVQQLSQLARSARTAADVVNRAAQLGIGAHDARAIFQSVQQAKNDRDFARDFLKAK